MPAGAPRFAAGETTGDGRILSLSWRVREAAGATYELVRMGAGWVQLARIVSPQRLTKVARRPGSKCGQRHLIFIAVD